MLLANGHTNVYRYPLALVWFEADLVLQRVKKAAVLDIVAMQAVLISSFGGKSGTKHLQKVVKELGDG